MMLTPTPRPDGLRLAAGVPAPLPAEPVTAEHPLVRTRRRQRDGRSGGSSTTAAAAGGGGEDNEEVKSKGLAQHVRKLIPQLG